MVPTSRQLPSLRLLRVVEIKLSSDLSLSSRTAAMLPHWSFNVRHTVLEETLTTAIYGSL